MTIHYSCVARDATILCSHQTGSGNFEEVAENMLPNIPTRNDGKTTYTSNNYSFHCIVENGNIYMCAAEEDFGKNQPYHYLAEIKRRFQSSGLATQAGKARAHELDSKFGRVMMTEMERFSKPGAGNDNISKLQAEVEDVKVVMAQNIRMVTERGEKLKDLKGKAEELEAGAAAFAEGAKRIRSEHWWKNKLILLCLVGVGVGILVIALVLIIHFSKSGDATSVATPVTTTGAVTTAAPVTTTLAAGR